MDYHVLIFDSKLLSGITAYCKRILVIWLLLFMDCAALSLLAVTHQRRHLLACFARSGAPASLES